MRYVLKPGTGADANADAVAALAGVEVVDRIGGALLVESDEATLAGHAQALASWTIARETRFAQPRPVRYTIGEG
jgi:hypothetical protein